LNGNPRTKWQRKGRLHIAKTFENIAKATAAAAVGMDLLRQAVERIHPVTFPSGGIVVPPPPKVGVAQMPTGEMVLNREQVAKLKHAININPIDSVRATISAENLSDVLQRMRERANKDYPIAYG
jgi:SLT domain-containing protein